MKSLAALVKENAREAVRLFSLLITLLRTQGIEGALERLKLRRRRLTRGNDVQNEAYSRRDKAGFSEASVEGDVRCVAFYLPQFHAIPENDRWWGRGFTEWVNVKKGRPLYEGHDQPRVPGELGYYDLSGEAGLEAQKKQMALAKEYGIHGFCYYYYWFDGGKRLLEMPIERHLQNKELDLPFCFCWANENWTRHWNGKNKDVLMRQSYKRGWEREFIMDLIPYLRDERYIRVNGAPYIMIYHPQEIPRLDRAIAVWRQVAKELGIPRLHISATRLTPDSEEWAYAKGALDSLTDFPPNLIGHYEIDCEDRGRALRRGQVKDYRRAVDYHARVSPKDFTYFRTAMLRWDNTARLGKNSYIYEHFSVEEYQRWLTVAKNYALRFNKKGEDLVFINAWNEWAEGTYLEPDARYGRRLLEATREALSGGL